MITLSDVAKAAGVSRSAASKALHGGGGKTTKISEKKSLHIQKIAEQLGYRPNRMAQRLASRKQDIIGLIVDSQCCRLYSDILSCIEQLTREAGYRLQVGLMHDSIDAIKSYVDDFLGYDIQSVICMAHYYEFSEKVPPLFKPFKNPLFISQPATDEKFSFVSPDYHGTFRKAMDYLFSLNRRKIIYVKSNYRTPDAMARARAFRDAHLAHGIPFDEAQIYCGDIGECDTLELMTELLDDVLPMRPDALIIGNGNATLWAIRLLNSRGLRVPEDVSIIGMESWKGSQAMQPSISVMDNNPAEIAREAVRVIINNIPVESPPLHEIFVEGSLILGESCCHKV
ncbi:MAG: LacI family transcriptional regulator [Oligosphaeraceae bacterium]|nr:LacI family transcriptional regulator [Oligosphaeraceae bacterium]